MALNGADRSPSTVVLAAYRAANRGRFADANRHVTSRLRNSFYASAKSIRASNASIMRSLQRRKPPDDVRLRELVQDLRQFEDPHYCWKGSTQGGSIIDIRVPRQTTPKRAAFVTVALQLADGRVRVERSRLLQKRSQWLIDKIEVEALQN